MAYEIPPNTPQPSKPPPIKASSKVALGRPAVRTSATTGGVLGWTLRLLAKVPAIRSFINDSLINLVTSSAKERPLPFSLWGPTPQPPQTPTSLPSADYVSWPGLVDRTFSGRHLPPCDSAFEASLPTREAMRPLFQRGRHMVACPSSSALFCFFAQWFTDSFLRTDPYDFRRNTSNHEIDLCQIYGLGEHDTRLLRAGRAGLLRSTPGIDGELPALLFDDAGKYVAAPFENLTYIDPKTRDFRLDVLGSFSAPERKRTLFASGLERGNTTIFYSGLNTLFLREHNRLARAIARAHPQFDDDRLFETARNVNMTQLLKLIIEDYINHLAATPVPFFVEPGKAEKRRWYRTNRISAEFNLLYRWHSLTPDTITLRGATLSSDQFRFNNQILRDHGVATILAEGSQQSAGLIGLRNTPHFLVDADLAALDKSRAWKLRGYNDYREAFGLPRLNTLKELTRDDELAGVLKGLYGHVDQVELIPGLLAEAKGKNAVLGELLRLMVGLDAFSQALTNPLLANGIYGADTFTEVGLANIEATRTLDDVGQRNLRLNGRQLSFSV